MKVNWSSQQRKWLPPAAVSVARRYSNININTNICSIELKRDGKITKTWHDNEMRWKRIKLWNEEIYSAQKVEQINDHLFIDTYTSNNIKIGMNDMTVNDSDMCVI